MFQVHPLLSRVYLRSSTKVIMAVIKGMLNCYRRMLLVYSLLVWLTWGPNVLGHTADGTNEVPPVMMKTEDVGYFWHITDIELDTAYATDGDVQNLCHKTPGSGTGFEQGAGMWGDYNCDSSLSLLTSASNALLQKGGSAPDFVLFTGNSHSMTGNITLDRVLTSMMRVYNEIRSSVSNLRVFPCLGQNDFYPRGRHTVDNHVHGMHLYKDYAHLYRFWIEDQAALEQFSHTGYYAFTMGKGSHLRIIVLNTNLFVETHIASIFPDPGGQWAWLEEELTKARSRKHVVYLVMSVPPGIYEKVYKLPGQHWFHPHHNRRYIQLVRRFGDIIRGQFAGHNHEDVFRIFYNRKERPISWMLLAPSVCPRMSALTIDVNAHSNPGLRLYMYDARTYEVIDYVQYYLNLTKTLTTSKARWEPAYTFSTYYSVPNISIYSFQLLINRLNDDFKFFDRYFEATSLMALNAGNCDVICKRYHTCAFSNIDYGSFFECISAQDASMQKRFWGWRRRGAAGLHPRATPALLCYAVVAAVLGVA